MLQDGGKRSRSARWVFAGLLATGVFVHHACVYRVFLLEDRWLEPSDRFMRALGGDGVNVFFMITGFLFWRKALLGGGRVDAVPLLRCVSVG